MNIHVTWDEGMEQWLLDLLNEMWVQWLAPSAWSMHDGEDVI